MVKRFNERFSKFKNLMKNEKIIIDYDSDEDFSQKNFIINDKFDIK